MMAALGESIVAIGVGATGLPLDAPRIAAALFGIVVAASLWWLYFDWVIYVSQAKLTDATGAARATLARDLYTYLHMALRIWHRGTRPRRSAVAVPKPKSMSSSDPSFIS
jgi:low temperature requirement protein LtrA